MNRMFKVLAVAGFAVATASADVMGNTASAVTQAAIKGLSRTLLTPAVPEPTAYAVLGLGVAAAFLFRRRPAR